MTKICQWPDGTWCEWADLEGHLQWMSDDFAVFELSDEDYEKFCNGELLLKSMYG